MFARAAQTCAFRTKISIPKTLFKDSSEEPVFVGCQHNRIFQLIRLSPEISQRRGWPERRPVTHDDDLGSKLSFL
jgi:hypothetical protein